MKRNSSNKRRALPVVASIGIDQAGRKAVSEALCHLLADTFTLGLKTRNFHWNVTGPTFSELHAMFETQYIDLDAATDLLAERIRALGFPAPGSLAQFGRLTSIPDETRIPTTAGMLQGLLDGHETLIRTLKRGTALAEHAGDPVTAGMLLERLTVHEKIAWMLRSCIS